MPKSRYTPPTSEVEERVKRMVGLYRQRLDIEDEYKRELAKLHGEDEVPVAYLAEQLGVERKTVYRHLGRSMT